MNFLDPQSTKDGKPWGPTRYKQIVRERYFISKNINTSYEDTGLITPLERDYLLEFIDEDLKRTKEMLDKNQKDLKATNNSAKHR